MTSSRAPSVLDEETLAQLRAIGDASFFAELIDLFVADALPRIEAMRGAIVAGDATRLAAEAHALKSSSGNVGAAAMRGICADLEAAARAAVLEDAARMLAQLEHEYAVAVSELRKVAP